MKTPLDNNLNKVYESFNQNHNHLRQTLMASLPDRSKQHKQTSRVAHIGAFIGDTIMKSGITKLAGAAVIIIAVMIGINHFGGSINVTGVAFALGDVVEALKHVENKHVIMKTNQPPATYEFWTKYSQNGEVIAKRIESPAGRLTVSVDGVTYNYIPVLDRYTNKIIEGLSRVYINSTKNIEDPVIYVEQMACNVAELGGTVTKQFESDEETGKRVLAMAIALKDIPFEAGRVGDVEAKIIFNAETKLPIRAQEYSIENGQKHRRAYYEFSYNEEFPEHLFKFEVPDGVQVVDTREKPGVRPETPLPMANISPEILDTFINEARKAVNEISSPLIQPDETWKLEDIVKLAHSHFSQIKDVEFDFISRLVILAHPEVVRETESTLAWVPEKKWEKRFDRVRKSTGEQYERFHSWNEVQENNSKGLGLSDLLTYLGLKGAKSTFIDNLTRSDVIIEGAGKIDGKKTVVINVNLTSSIPRKEGLFRKYWLDMERGALPLRVELYHKGILMLVASGVTTSEIEPGVFFPVSCNVSGGLGRKNEVDGARETRSYQSYKVDINSIKINQGLERQYFDVEFAHSPASWDTGGVK